MTQNSEQIGTEKKTKSLFSKALYFLSWNFAILFILGGIKVGFTQELPFVVASCYILIGLVLLPPLTRFVQNRFRFNLNSRKKAVCITCAFVIAGFSISLSSQGISNNSNETENQVDNSMASVPQGSTEINRELASDDVEHAKRALRKILVSFNEKKNLDKIAIHYLEQNGRHFLACFVPGARKWLNCGIFEVDDGSFYCVNQAARDWMQYNCAVAQYSLDINALYNRFEAINMKANMPSIEEQLAIFRQALKSSGADSVIEEISRDRFTGELVIVVKDEWHYQHYQERLQAAQTLWEVWAKLHSPDKMDSARIRLVDYNDNVVGGSRTLAGSLIWVKK